MSLVDKLLGRVGKTRADVSSNSNAGKMFRKRGVRRTQDFERVLQLPRRKWQDGVFCSPEEMAELLTKQYGRPTSTCESSCVCRGKGTMALKPIQAAAL